MGGDITFQSEYGIGSTFTAKIKMSGQKIDVKTFEFPEISDRIMITSK